MYVHIVHMYEVYVLRAHINQNTDEAFKNKIVRQI